MKDLVSIIIPTYKRPGMLGRAIDSCLKQTYKNIEIIIVDDNNPNSEGRKETEKFMQKYKNNPQIMYIKREINGGGCASRNTGIDNANGQYISFLDDDDYFFSTKIETQLKYMKQKKLDASFTGVETFDETKNRMVKIKKHDNFEKYGNVLVYHLVEMIVSPQTFMYRSDVLKKIGGFDDYPAGQEYYLMLKTLINGYKVDCIHEVLTRICIHSGERITTGKNKIKAEKNLLNVKKKYFNLLNFEQRQTVKYIYKYNVWQRYKSLNSFKSILYFLWIIISHPILLLKRKVIR